MKVRKWVCFVVFDAREADDYFEGYVKQSERVLRLQEDMERLVLQRAGKLDFRQFYHLGEVRCGVSNSEIDPKEVEAEANLFGLLK